MKNETTAPSARYARVQRTLAINRKAALSFPCVFMGMTGRRSANDDVTLEFDDDATFRDGKGELGLSALSVLADAALGAAVRFKTGPTVRPATVHLEMQVTGASTQGRVVTEGRFVGFSDRDSVRQSFVGATIRAGETPIAYASAAFALFDLPEGKTQAPELWPTEEFAAELIDAAAFDSDEREALERCESAEAAATEALPFIDHFWCGIPEASEGEAHLSVGVTPHLGNRVGHVHGGLLVGAAASAANAAAPGNMRLSNISAWFVSPGLGPRLEVHASVVQEGRSLALVHTRILSASGKLVLDTTSQHVATNRHV